MLPLLIVNSIVVIVPSVSGILYAYTDWNGIGDAHWVGLSNFQTLFQDPIFFKAFSNNIIYTALFLTLPIMMGLLGAYLLAGITHGQVIYRLIYFIPYMFSSVINTQIWRYLLHPKYGIGAALANYGITFLDFPIFGRRDTALFGIVFVDGWHWWGFLVVIYLAAMTQVDRELYEVARLDGATRFQQFRFVTLPSIRPTLIFTLLIIFIGTTLVFDHVYILTGGGPAHASEVMSTYLYTQAFQNFDVGYAASIGVILSLWVSVPLLLFYYLRRRGWEI
ncbi:MAG: sugar ABC transporter permease [Anaerolineae bacterium]|nr:sugar ABC transporter permease [Anaerolineae bacterium]